MSSASAGAPADVGMIAPIRAHLLATFVAGIVATALDALADLQLLSPGILGGAAWLGVGRLQFAYTLALFFGWLGNALAICVYLAFPWVASVVVRLRVGALKFGIWNFVITAPIVVMALLGILPPARVLTAWFALSSVPQSIIALSGMLFVPSILITVRLWLGLPSRPFDRSFALIALGAFGLVIGGIGGQAAQAAAMRSGEPWLDGLAAMHAYWITSGVSRLLILCGCVLGCAAISRPADGVRIPITRMSRWAFGIGILAVVIWPVALYFAETLDASSRPTTASEARGRATFVREGCASCHAAEGHVGIGPDLSRESGVHPADWHYTHLFSPRAVTPWSVMPSYARLFDGAPDRPTQEGRDLVAYLDALGRARDLGAPAADAAAVHPATLNPARARRTGAAGLRPKPANLAAHRYSDQQIAAALWNGVAGTAMPAWRDQPLNRIAMLIAAAQSFGEYAGRPALQEQAGLPTKDRDMGARVYATHCVQCHGERGGGDGFSALSLTVAPANFQRQQPSLDYALRVIAGGVEGTPMAPWTSRMSEQELLAVAHYVRSFHKGGAR